MKYKRIRDLREDMDLSQEKIAEKIGLYTTTYARYERGEREIPFDIVIELAKYYNISIDYLAGLINTPRTLDGTPFRIGGRSTTEEQGTPRS